MSDLEVMLLVLSLVLLSIVLWVMESERRRDMRMRLRLGDIEFKCERLMMQVDSLVGERDRLMRECSVMRRDVNTYKELYELKVSEIKEMKRVL